MEVHATTIDGLEATELRTRTSAVVLLHGAGPRIAAFHRADGDNLLFWDADARETRGDWQLRGGHRLWTTRPGADESEETYAPDPARCRLRRAAQQLIAIAPPTRDGIEKSLGVKLLPDGRWLIEHRLRNTSTMLWSGGAWAITCTRPAASTQYRVPFGPVDPAWDTITVVMPRAWGGNHTAPVNDPQFAMTEEGFVIRASGTESKRMIRAAPGRLEMRDRGRGRFVIEAPFDPRAAYPLDTNLAVYLAPRAFMVELETMSPLTVLKPGETLVHRETWSVA